MTHVHLAATAQSLGSAGGQRLELCLQRARTCTGSGARLRETRAADTLRWQGFPRPESIKAKPQPRMGFGTALVQPLLPAVGWL